ncbi:twin-arginine translocase subunit TatC [Methanolobus sp. WCC4]|uniref:twin-arginine translocase subunit TatC n=1 Tax=Methanolobus sp. WCC4 TaxID=3125784 RepID=UPI0030FB7D71
MDYERIGNQKRTENKVNSGSSGVSGDYNEHVIYHLRELRNRFVVIILAMLLCVIVTYPFTEALLTHAWNTFLGENIEMNIYTPFEWMFARLKISLLMAVAFTLPFTFYELFRFASRGLYPNERKFVKSVVPVSFIFFIGGAAIALIFILPLMFDYIILASEGFADNQISVKQTVSMAVTLMAGTGLVFQIPVLMFFATRMQLIRHATLKKMRLVVYASLLTLSLFITPDPTFIAQLVCAVLLIVLFEIGLLVSR